MGVFSTGGVGVDPGSANITICLENEGVVLREPSYVLVSRDDASDVLAVGRDARTMLGRTPRETALFSPIQDGAVADIGLARLMISSLAEKSLGRRRALEKNRLVVCLSQGATPVERAALEETVRQIGSKRAAVLRAGIAAALGAGLEIDGAKGVMLVNIGATTTEINVLSMNSVIAARTPRTGSLSLDEAIARYVRREKNLVIGLRTAEDLKLDLGSAMMPKEEEDEEVMLRGRDAHSGRPSTTTISAREVHKSILQPLEDLLESIREAFENTPPELAADILENGLLLTGGGALLTGLKEKLESLTGLKVRLSPSAQDDAAVGACIAASDEKTYQKLIKTGCLTEI